ncbi:hypothetical protein BMS3Bbin06_00722 [bacterium BMS3Bbin06]|nr:hypothetical protein BMS3Bbin06_00722 [bacterium BMS3Bbin06]
MGTEKITAEQDLVFFQIGRHSLRPVNPGSVYELQRFVSERYCLTIINGNKEFLGYTQKVHKHPFCFWVANQLCVGVFREYRENAAGVVLFSVKRNYVIEFRNIFELSEQFIGHGWVNRINQNRFFAALNKISVIACSVRKRNQ